MADRTVWKFTAEQELTPADELLLFLMVICHQPYRDACELNVDQAIRLTKGFGGWMEMLFNGKGASDTSHAFVPNLTLPPEWQAKLARDKAATKHLHHF